MMCQEKYFEECSRCENDGTGQCVAEKVILRRIVSKLTEEENLMLVWLIAKAKGAGEFSAEQFAESLAKAFSNGKE